MVPRSRRGGPAVARARQEPEPPCAAHSRRAALGRRDNEVIKHAVQTGAGTGILSVVVIAREVRDGEAPRVRIRDREFLRPLHLAYHRQRAESLVIHAFVP
jgi:DNA-binding transcriptional LysR family regulator